MMLGLRSLVFAISAAFVSAGTFVSPTAGSTVVEVDGAINVTWVSSRFFEESSQSISVLLEAVPAGTETLTEIDGLILATDLAPVALGFGEEGPTYSALLTPRFEADSSMTGQFALIIVEDYTAFGGNAAIGVEYEMI
ncbi:hypothetical protein BT96DRAFT_917870, partial [Gymnopus androsaceus JB14]